MPRRRIMFSPDTRVDDGVVLTFTCPPQLLSSTPRRAAPWAAQRAAATRTPSAPRLPGAQTGAPPREGADACNSTRRNGSSARLRPRPQHGCGRRLYNYKYLPPRQRHLRNGVWWLAGCRGHRPQSRSPVQGSASAAGAAARSRASDAAGKQPAADAALRCHRLHRPPHRRSPRRARAHRSGSRCMR